MAAEPVVRKHTVPAMRGRILARDGTVLAYDQPLVNLALNYRWLEEPADTRWLYRMARARLSAAERRDSKRIAQEEEQILAERRDLHERLASLCGMSEAEWHERTEQIQKRVEALAGTVNARHENAREAQRRKADDTSTDSPIGWLEVVSRSIGEALSAWDDDSAASWLSVAEEQSEHVICADLPLEAVAEIETHPAEYPGVTLTHSYRRAYPQGELAAHAVGYLGLINAEELTATQSAAGADAESNQPDDLIGRAGVERQYEKMLRGHRGLTIEQVDARGHTISSTVVRQPKAGSDVVLTIDPALQRTAQALLDQALARRLPGGDGEIDKSAGGALVAMDIQSGAILAAASGPRFNCDGFAQGDREAITNWLNDPARPLFDRTVQMALPPGSVFKTVSAVAMLSVGVNPDAAFECQGYLKQPDALRCAIFRRYGIGHGAVTLSDALARSCNVYFFHYASQIGAAPLIDWRGG